MYYSYIEIEYVAMSFSPTRTNLALKLLIQELVATTIAVTITMQILQYHVKYNTTTNQTHLKQTTVVVGVRVILKKRVTIVVTSTT
jgi:hypothetical protein